MNNKISLLVTVSVLILSLPARAEFTEPNLSGIASNYSGDVGIGNDPKVVFTENFEEGSVGAITSRWESTGHPEIMSLVTDVPAASAGEHSILMTHVGGDGNGGYLYRRLLPGHDQLYLRFYVKFDTDCWPIHHFVKLGGYNPSTPWPQGGAGTRPEGDDWLVTGVETYGTDWRWEFYTYWMEMRGNPVPDKYWGNNFISDGNLTVDREEWICVELMMKMNNPTTERNGEQAIWINGKLWMKEGQIVSHLGEGFPNGYWVWSSFYPDPGSAPFEGFRWRSAEALNLNFLCLELYITTAPSGYVSKVWFDDVVVAKEYIGPINEFRCDIGDVNSIDYAVFASHWLDETCEGPEWCDCTDFDGSGSVDIDDLARFAGYWFESHGPFELLEAEDYTSKADGSGAAAGSIWMELTGEGSSGDGYMRAMPDIGRIIDTNIESESPHLAYEIDFAAAGTYYLWLKGWAEDPFSQFVHYGLDGSAVSSGVSNAAKLSHDDAFTWQSERGDGSRPTLVVETKGVHTLDIWMREDGTKIDRLLLVGDPDYIPDNP